MTPASTVERRFVSTDTPTAGRQGAGGRPAQGLFHAAAGRRSRICVIATHYEVDFSEHYLAELLGARGFGFLGWNTRYRGAGAYFILEHALIDIGAGVRWLREHAGADAVVLLGNSGGASLMAAYQSQAVEPNLEAVAGMSLPDAVTELPRAEAFVSLNAHPGRPEVLTAWMDPSVTDEEDPLSVDPSLDMFALGPPFPAAFVERYRRAQRERNDRITEWVGIELERMKSAGAWDRLFNVHRVWADLRFRDVTIDPSDREPGCYLGDPKRANYGPFGIAQTNTLRTWLSMWSLETSQCTARPHLERIREPALVVQSTADRGCFPSDAAAIHDALGSEDKTLEFVEGEHYLRSPAEAREDVADLIAGWLEERL